MVCDLVDLACIPACVSAIDGDPCQFTFEDRDGEPGAETIVDEGAEHPAACNSVTGRCELPGDVPVIERRRCVEDADCGLRGFCVRSSIAPDEGRCARIGCGPLDPCAVPATCATAVRGVRGGVCVSHCVVGAETRREQWLGPAGGHPDCAPGVACFWDGVHDASSAYNGVCLVGNYNSVAAYNVGAVCTTDAECWSPYGLGRCLFASWGLGIGVCGVTGCGSTDGEVGLAVGTDTVPVADPGAVCDVLRGHSCQPIVEDRTGRAEQACVQICTQAADCDVGLACSRREHVCTPRCADDGECRSRDRCTTTPERPGRCVPE